VHLPWLLRGVKSLSGVLFVVRSTGQSFWVWYSRSTQKLDACRCYATSTGHDAAYYFALTLALGLEIIENKSNKVVVLYFRYV